MGYRSEIAYGVKVDDIILKDNATEEDKKIGADGIFLVMLTEMQQDPIAGKCFDNTYEINDYLVVDKEKKSILFSANSVKWYDSFEDVQAHERLYQIMEEYANVYGDMEELARNPISCAFIRIGEEIEDIEERGNGDDPWGIMNVYRGIDIHI